MRDALRALSGDTGNTPTVTNTDLDQDVGITNSIGSLITGIRGESTALAVGDVKI